MASCAGWRGGRVSGKVLGTFGTEAEASPGDRRGAPSCCARRVRRAADLVGIVDATVRYQR